MIRIKNFINGQFLDSVTSKTLNSVNPSTAEVHATLPASEKEDVALAFEAAQNAFKMWGKTTAQERASYLYKIADLIDAHLDELAECESRDQGKPLWLAKTVDIPRAAANFRFFAGAILHESSEFHQTTTSTYNYSLRQPVGVCGLISPWNLPLYLLTWKIAPAIATGNTCIAKPSEVTPLTAFKLSEILIEAGLPDGVVNIVHGLGTDVGDAITSHPKIPLISFTGGTSTGKMVYRNAVETFKKVSLELGGKNPNIIFNDANYEKALNFAVRSSFTNQGEICLCGSRIYVQRDIYDQFISDFKRLAEAIIVGDPMHPESKMGALVSKDHYDKVCEYIEIAKEEGGTLLTGGKRVQGLAEKNKNGYFLEPTILLNLPHESRCIQEEIFGPVVVVTPFDTEDEVLKLANGTTYGLAATIWTEDLKKAHRFAAEVDSGIVWVNTWMMRDLRTPFGGMRSSGVGREGGRYSLEFYSKVKNVCIEF